MVATNIANMKVGRNWANLPNKNTNSQAAEKLNISERSVKSAKQVKEKGIPELIGTDAKQGERSDLTSQCGGKFNLPSQTANHYRKLARISILDYYHGGQGGLFFEAGKKGVG